MHFGAALERKGLNRKLERKKAVIVCIAGVATAMLLKEKIEQNFGHQIEVVKTCPQREVTKELIEQVDLVLTTVELPDFQSEKIKKINLFLEESDIRTIKYALRDSNREESIDYRGIFREDLFFSNSDFKEKSQILAYMTEKMMQKDFMSKDAAQSVVKREEMATTELGNLVAIPHAMSNDSGGAVVSVMVLKKPIVWENEKVQVILLLNIPKSQYSIWEIVFKRLYRYLIEDQGVSRLIKEQGYEEFIEQLQNREE